MASVYTQREGYFVTSSVPVSVGRSDYYIGYCKWLVYAHKEKGILSRVQYQCLCEGLTIIKGRRLRKVSVVNTCISYIFSCASQNCTYKITLKEKK